MSPLIHQNIEFHNAAALEPLCGMPGLCPVRLPRALRETLNPGAQSMALSAAGVELRLVTSGPKVRLAFASHQEEVQLHAYLGEFGFADWRVPAGASRVVQLSLLEHFPNVRREALASGAFSPDVWRVQISGGTLSFLGMEDFGDEVRPPLPTEKPARRWLAYGSSITNSWAKGYPHLAARRLGVDVLNKGLSGSCQCEPTLAEHLATCEDWDFATLELGVNMRGSFSPAEFEKRARNLVERLRAGKPDAPLVLITHFLNRDHAPKSDTPTPVQTNQREYDRILREIAAENADNGVFLIEGTELLTDFCGLSCDLLHPSDHGHMQMGENLARRLRDIPGCF